jgi:hypothetical protein
MSDSLATYFSLKHDLSLALFTCDSEECRNMVETAMIFEMMPFIFLSGLCLLAVFLGAIFVFCTGRSLRDFFSALWDIFLEVMGN